MHYWVKNSICLFYNTPINTVWQDSFNIGYAEMRQGRYVAVAFRWIDSVEELTQIYESITRKKIDSYRCCKNYRKYVKRTWINLIFIITNGRKYKTFINLN